jgi:hypothetical protein
VKTRRKYVLLNNLPPPSESSTRLDQEEFDIYNPPPTDRFGPAHRLRPVRVAHSGVSSWKDRPVSSGKETLP